MTAPLLVSIVLPTHNGRKYLDQSIQSVLEQTYPHWELIVVNDGSTDGTAEIIDGWCARDQRIRAIHLTSNRRLPGALNEGFRQARGALLTWTSDDNWYGPEALATFVAIFAQDQDVALAYSDHWVVDDSGACILRHRARPPAWLTSENCVSASFMYRREVYESVGDYDESLFLGEDYDYWLRVARDHTLRAIDRPLYYYRRHNESLSARRKHEIALTMERILLNCLTAAPSLPAVQARILAHLAYWSFQRGDGRQGRRYLLRAMRHARGWPVGRPSLLVEFVFGPRIGNLLRRSYWSLRRSLAIAGRRASSPRESCRSALAAASTGARDAPGSAR